MNTMKALKRSPLELDLYRCLTDRSFALKKPVFLTWRRIYRRYGVDPTRDGDEFAVRDFRRKSLRELKKIGQAWPELNYGIV